MKKICRECESDGVWLPTSIAKLEKYLGKFIQASHGVPNVVGLRKNIAYNLQYLEYQYQTLSEFKLTSVIYTQTWKVFIIVGTSIVEAILHYLINSKGLGKTTEWKKVRSTGNEINIEDEKYKLENIIYKKLEKPMQVEMTLDAMIKKSERKKLLGRNHEIYKKLNHLRKVRNRVHIHAIDEDYDTDWNKIQAGDFKTVKIVLYSFMTSSLFEPTVEERRCFEYLLANT